MGEYNNLYEKTPLGRPAVFFLPSIKINNPEKKIKEEIGDFLLKEFGGYTLQSGNIEGCWRGKSGMNYDQSLVYTVAFLGKDRIPTLEKFLAGIAKEIGEEAIYLETGEDSWLIKPK